MLQAFLDDFLLFWENEILDEIVIFQLGIVYNICATQLTPTYEYRSPVFKHKPVQRVLKL